MSQDPLNLLCVETRFPSRLGAVADWLVRKRGYRCHFFCHQLEPRETWPETVSNGLVLIQFNVGGVAREASVSWTRALERGLCHAYGAWEVIDNRRPRPLDVALGRSYGMGSTLFLPVYQPRLPIVNFFDYYYLPRVHDLADEDASTLPHEYIHWRRSANAMDLLDLENGVVPWTATRWQRDLYPEEYRDDFVVVPDGVDAARFPQRRGPRPRTIAGRSIPEGTRLVTFVARSLDRLRGFDRFAELAARLIAERPDVVCVAVGEATVGRTLDLKFYGRDYASEALGQFTLRDHSRFWRLGVVSPAVVGELLAASDLHVVPSRPYPVSRSLLEAMAAGTVVLAWDTPPVREVLEPDRTAHLVADSEAAFRAALAVLDDPAAHRPLGDAAREEARERWDRDVTLPRLVELFDEIRKEPQRHRAKEKTTTQDEGQNTKDNGPRRNRTQIHRKKDPM
jgi:glycosyltransferase involved in cell wall biosynthesis